MFQILNTDLKTIHNHFATVVIFQATLFDFHLDATTFVAAILASTAIQKRVKARNA